MVQPRGQGPFYFKAESPDQARLRRDARKLRELMFKPAVSPLLSVGEPEPTGEFGPPTPFTFGDEGVTGFAPLPGTPQTQPSGGLFPVREAALAQARAPRQAMGGLQAPVLTRPAGEGRIAPTPGVLGTVNGLAPIPDRYLHFGRYSLDKQTRTVYLDAPTRYDPFGLNKVALPWQVFQAALLVGVESHSGKPNPERRAKFDRLFKLGMTGHTEAWGQIRDMVGEYPQAAQIASALADPTILIPGVALTKSLALAGKVGIRGVATGARIAPQVATAAERAAVRGMRAVGDVGARTRAAMREEAGFARLGEEAEEYLYHGTSIDNLERIRRDGLVSKTRQRNDYGSRRREYLDEAPDEELLYFDEQLTSAWGGKDAVQLRVNRAALPKDVWVDEDLLRPGEIFASGGEVSFTIPPEAIQYLDKTSRRWKALIPARKARQPEAAARAAPKAAVSAKPVRLGKAGYGVQDIEAALAQPAPKPVRPPKAAPTAAVPETRKPFTASLFQGKGATLEQVYGAEAVAQGRAVPLFGKGDYFAFTQKDASVFGRVSQQDVTLSNPFVLDSDAKWFQLLRDADTPHLNNMDRLFYTEPQGIEPATQKLQSFLKAQGYDGIVVRLAKDDSTRRLAAMVGNEQVVQFTPARAAPEGALAVRPPAPVAAARPAEAAAEAAVPPRAPVEPPPVARPRPIMAEAAQVQREMRPPAGQPPAAAAAGQGPSGPPIIPPSEVPPLGPPLEAGGVPPVPVGPVTERLLDLKNIVPGLTRQQAIVNIARGLVGRVSERVGFAIKSDPFAMPAMTLRSALRTPVVSQASRVGASVGNIVRTTFKLDPQGRIPSLAGIVKEIPGGPTLQDVAARLPLYWDALSDAERAAMTRIRAAVSPFRDLLDEVGVELSSRTDVMEGGFYLPRGRAALEGADMPVKVRAGFSGAGGKKGFERPAVFDSQAAGIEAGYEYAPLGDAVGAYASDAGTRAVDQYVVNYFKAARTSEGQLLGETPKARLLRQNPRIAKQHEGLIKELNRLKLLRQYLSEKQRKVIDSFVNDAGFDDIDALRAAIIPKIKRPVFFKKGVGGEPDIFRVMPPGRNFGKDTAQVNAEIARVDAAIKAMAPEWKAALRRAALTPREQGQIGLAGLQGTTFPDAVANAANKVLQSQAPTSGELAALSDAIAALNNIYRGARATLDNSAPGIQGLLALYNNPKAWGRALKVNFRAWADSDVLGAFFNDFDKGARAAGTAPVSMWARKGVRLGGPQTEYQIGQVGEAGLMGKLAGLPGIRQANRAFGYYGDSLRLWWADDLLREELRRGKTLAQLDADGTLERIARSVNQQTGWSEGRVGGNLGDLVLFAPRFLQSRLETVANGALGLRPGAALEQRIARRSLLRLVGIGTLTTVALNELLGNDTDFRPVLNGRPNANFMRVRWGGRDWSLFGTWDSLARAFILTGGGHPEQAWRSLGSGFVANTWDFMTGETAIGKRTRDTKFQFVQRMLENFVPFSAGDVARSGKEAAQAVRRGQYGAIGPAGAALAFAEFGGKVAPLSVADVRDQEAKRLFRKPYWELHQDDQDVVDKTAAVVAKKKEQPSERLSVVAREKITADRLAEEAGLAADFEAGRFESDSQGLKRFRDTYDDIQTRAAARRAQLNEDFRLFQKTGELPEDLNERATVQYYAAFDKARRPSGEMDFDRLARFMALLDRSWKPEQKAWVEKDTGQTEHVGVIGEFVRAKKFLSKVYWSIGDEYGPENAWTPRQAAAVETRRLMLASSNLAVDTALVKFYGRTPKHRTNMLRLRQKKAA